MDVDSDSRVILKYYLSRATGNPGFIWPIYTLYLLLHGITYTQIGVIATIQSVIVVAGEVPTGYVGDRIGRRNSLLIGSLLFTASTISYLIVETFAGFVLTFALLSFGNTFISGSGDAWLYDTLQEQLNEDRYTHVRGRGNAISQWVMSITMIAGGLLYVVEPTYPFIVAAAMNVVNVLVVLSLPKNRQYTEDGEDEERLTVLDALPVVRRQLSVPPLRSFVLYMSLFTGALMTADMLIQPVAVDALEGSIEPLLESYGIPEAATLGFLYSGFTVASAIASDYASDVEAALGVRRVVLLIPVGIAVMYVLPVVAPLLVFPTFFVMKASGSVLRPIVSRYLNDHTESVGRATVLSAVSMVYALAGIPFRIGSGAVADLATPLVAVATLGGAFLVGAAVVYAWSPPVPRSEVGTDPVAD